MKPTLQPLVWGRRGEGMHMRKGRPMKLFVWMLQFEDGSEYADVMLSVNECKETLRSWINEYNDGRDEADWYGMPGRQAWDDLADGKEMTETVDQTTWHIIPVARQRSVDIRNAFRASFVNRMTQPLGKEFVHAH